LPEVETTVRGLRKTIIGLAIRDVWTDLATKDKRKTNTVADPKYFKVFKKEILNKKICRLRDGRKIYDKYEWPENNFSAYENDWIPFLRERSKN